MSEIIAVVTGIKKDMAKNGKPFYRIALDNGENVTAWDFNAIRGVQKGDRARLTVEKSQNGKFLHLVASAPLVGDSMEDDPPFEDEEDEESPKPGTSTLKDLPFKKVYAPQNNSGNNPFITRMSALKTAVDYLNYCKPVDGVKFKPVTEAEVIDTALMFVDFIESGMAVEDEE